MGNSHLVPKVLTTCDATGTLNVVPKGTLSAVDEETIAFADIRGDKTNANLKATSKTAGEKEARQHSCRIEMSKRGWRNARSNG